MRWREREKEEGERKRRRAVREGIGEERVRAEGTGKCGKDDSARRDEKHIKGVAFRVDKYIAPSRLDFSNSKVYQSIVYTQSF